MRQEPFGSGVCCYDESDPLRPNDTLDALRSMFFEFGFDVYSTLGAVMDRLVPLFPHHLVLFVPPLVGKSFFFSVVLYYLWVGWVGIHLIAMSSSSISTSTRSRTSTSKSRTGSSTSRPQSTSSNVQTETFIPTNSLTTTGLITASVPVQTESTSSLVPTPAPTSNPSDNGGPKPPVAVIAVSTILGVLVIGAVAFLLVFRCRRRRGQSPYITRHEPKRRDTHPQPTIQESSLYLASKEEDEKSPMSPTSSLDVDIMRSPKSRIRTSRASSSIFIDDRDDVTVSSRSNHFPPLSLGESLRGFHSPPSAASQPTPLSDRFSSNKDQLPTIPGTPATPRFAIFSPEEQDGEVLIARAPPSQVTTLSRTTTRNSNRSSSSRTKTRNSTPPTPTASLPPSPPPPIPLPPLPNSFDDSKRASTSTLTAPSRPGFGDSRPLSVQSAYSFQSQNLGPNYPGTLSPDILATLERLKKRISTPWSINSVDTENFNKTTAD
ncbi:unnamed protein product [Rhizoctonia solani]|uniref:Uncharacterized protein n=1 Tax=Rhizoctonia solani TaxID=456999 RepID=A0A8H3D6X0_9AGAM|nr:unnamed protein product [Rhizoctonia solani]